MKAQHALFVAVALALLLMDTNAQSQSAFKDDGWHSWSVEAIEDAPDWCCYEWNNKKPVPVACDLNSKNVSYSTSDSFTSQSGRMQIYALRKSGVLSKVRTLSDNCPVKSNIAITDLGAFDNDNSVALIAPLISTSKHTTSDALAAIAVHTGDAAGALLEKTARSHSNLHIRKDAVFWIGQARVNDSGAVLRDLMLSDKVQALREHAVFSYAQSDASDREDTLVSVVENRSLSDDERKNALFWLAQTESPKAIDYIQELLVGKN